MRIWTIHPQYLDVKGLTALWREALLAKNVLEGKTKGYKYHPQLERFKSCNDPVEGINHYLLSVYNEAARRGYKYDKSKFNFNSDPLIITVTSGQIEYEKKHLLKKLKVRDNNKYEELFAEFVLKTHPMFRIVDGDVESWERII